MIESHLILALAWIAFCILHSVLAAAGVKQYMEKQLGRYFFMYRLCYTSFALFSFAAIIIYEACMATFYLFIPIPLVLPAGLACCFAGAMIMARCMYKYFLRFTGLRTAFGNHDEKVLFTDGLNRYVRHPLYAGTLLFIWGAFIAMPYASLFVSNCILTVYTLVGIRFEEKKLVQEFGAAYTNYKKKVPMIIPTFGTQLPARL